MSVRMDSRQLLQRRAQSIETPSFISLIADRTIRVQRGYSCIEMSILLSNGDDPLVISGISTDKLTNPFSTNKSTVKSTNTLSIDEYPSLVDIREYLRKCGVSCLVTVTVIKDDGNIYDMFFSGIKSLFESVDMIDCQSVNFEIPETYAIFDSIVDNLANNLVDDNLGNSVVKIVADPTLLEEKSCDAILHIINKRVIVEGRISRDTLKKCISEIIV